MLYSMFELSRAAMMPWRTAANMTRRTLRAPWNPMGDSLMARSTAAAADLFESITRYYGKPTWDVSPIEIDGKTVDVKEDVVWKDSWCQLLHFKRNRAQLARARGGKVADIHDPKVLIVAPMSGHYATLLRGTVEAFLPDNEVYITDWSDARMVPIMEGRFDLDSYIDYVRRMIREVGPDVNVAAVCQPGPPTLAAIALMAEDEEPTRPLTMTFMGSPIDARKSPTVPNVLAENRPFSWFRDNLIHTVPPVYPGGMRRVYPGFLQLTGFINMNFERHIDAHQKYFNQLIEGDGDSTDKHRRFYDEYLSVMDLSEEFYLQTIRDVFQEHKLPRGEMLWQDRPVRPQAIKDVALMTVEGEKDDISGIGQTQAAHDLCENLPAKLREDWVQPGVGHYGVFNGRRFREEIAPRMRQFWAKHANRQLKAKAA